MSRKSSRTAVDDVTDAMQTVTDNVAKVGRRARKKAEALAAKAGVAPKPRHRKRKFALVVLLLAGIGVAARKTLGAKSGSDDAAH
jgi:hypothetical protein